MIAAYPKSTNLSTRSVKQRNTSSVEVSVLLHVHSWIFFKDNVNEWVTFAFDGTSPADESKRTKRVQGWSRLNWLGGVLIIVSWHIHFNKLLMPYARMLLCQLGARFTVSKKTKSMNTTFAQYF